MEDENENLKIIHKNKVTNDVEFGISNQGRTSDFHTFSYFSVPIMNSLSHNNKKLFFFLCTESILLRPTLHHQFIVFLVLYFLFFFHTTTHIISKQRIQMLKQIKSIKFFPTFFLSFDVTA